jgi:homocysteine S-methyltransferase
MEDNRFLAELEKRVLLGSGAMGTELLRRGALADGSLDELNLTRPHSVLDLSREYVRAGADVVKTNTFLANRYRLHSLGLGKKVREINLAGAQIARDAAKGAFVAGCVGPLAELGSDFLVYREQCEALAEGGCDLILFETFMNFADLQVALKAGWTTGLPVVCQTANLAILPGLEKLTEVDVDLVGVNCKDPAEIVPAITRLGEHAAVPRCAFPSAGLPGKEMTPATFAGWIEALVKAGARLVGGCCGAGPEHIAASAEAVGKGR